MVEARTADEDRSQRFTMVEDEPRRPGARQVGEAAEP